jgi:hypothetical protein
MIHIDRLLRIPFVDSEGGFDISLEADFHLYLGEGHAFVKTWWMPKHGVPNFR